MKLYFRSQEEKEEFITFVDIDLFPLWDTPDAFVPVRFNGFVGSSTKIFNENA